MPCDEIEILRCRRRDPRMAIPRLRLLKNRDEHRRNILQTILRFGAIEKGGVLPEFVRHLVNDEGAARPERVVRILEQSAFLLDLENAEGDAGENVIALRDAAARELLGETGGVAIDDVDARIIGELPLEVARKGGIEFEEEQLRIGIHPRGQLARMDAFARTVLGDYARLAEIHLARHPLHKRLGAGDDGGDLKRLLQKPFEKQCAHKVANSEPRVPRCPATISWPREPIARISSPAGSSGRLRPADLLQPALELQRRLKLGD